MIERIDHAAEAHNALSGSGDGRNFATDASVNAVAHAVLALAEQQRIANLIQLALGGRGGWIGVEPHAHEALIKTDARNVPRIHPDIAAALGIGVESDE